MGDTNSGVARKFDVLVSECEAEWVSSSAGEKFGRYIDNLPWRANRVNFNILDGRFISLDLYHASDDAILQFLKKSALSKYPFVAFYYLDNHPLLISGFDVVKRRFLEFLTYPGDAMAFGFFDIEEASFSDFMVINSWQALAVYR